ARSETELHQAADGVCNLKHWEAFWQAVRDARIAYHRTRQSACVCGNDRIPVKVPGRWAALFVAAAIPRIMTHEEGGAGHHGNMLCARHDRFHIPSFGRFDDPFASGDGGELCGGPGLAGPAVVDQIRK